MTKNENVRLYNLAEVARLLNLSIGKNQLYEFLRLEDILEYNNAPKSQFINKGYFVYKVVKKKWYNHTFVMPLVTEQGLGFIDELFKTKRSEKFSDFLNPKNPSPQ